MTEPITEHETEQAEANDIIAWLGEPADILQIPDVKVTRELEIKSRALMAVYQERNDYDKLMEMWEVYIFSRRRTTEICIAEIEGNTRVTLQEIGFTKQQWYLRRQEYKPSVEQVNEYFDKYKAYGWVPSLASLRREFREQAKPVDEQRAQILLHRQKLLDTATWLKFNGELTIPESNAINKLIDTFTK